MPSDDILSSRLSAQILEVKRSHTPDIVFEPVSFRFRRVTLEKNRIDRGMSDQQIGEVVLRFYEELNDFLPEERRKASFSHRLLIGNSTCGPHRRANLEPG